MSHHERTRRYWPSMDFVVEGSLLTIIRTAPNGATGTHSYSIGRMDDACRELREWLEEQRAANEALRESAAR